MATQRSSSRPRRGRAAKVSRAPARTPAYISRKIPQYELLGPDGLDRIEAQADQILDRQGIEIRGDEHSLGLFEAAGARRDGERLRFEPGLVRHIVKRSTPRRFVQRSRNVARSVTIGENCLVFAPAYGSPFVRDLEGGRRYGTINDFENLVKLAYSLPSLHHSGGTICEPVDVPVNKRHLDMVYAHMRWSDKPFMGSVTAPERAADSIALCRILYGEKYVDDHCVILGNINVNSPLVYDGQVTRVIRTYSAANQGIVICPFILGGAMGPVTVAGAVALAHAESMVGVALAQLTRPGAPVIYGNFLSTMSLRSGAPTFGMPEAALAYMVVGQLARRLGVPLRCGGSFTASKIADAQAAQESADALMPALIAGCNFVLHAAGWLEGGLTMGYEKMLLDADHLGMMAVMLRGLELDDNALAVAAFEEVDPGGHFLGSAHTLANYETAYYESALANSDSFEKWREEGAKDAQLRASERCAALLSNYEPPPIDEAVDQALCEFIEHKKNSMEAAWY